ncbi:MAG: hypothetical protein IKY41_07505 [Clostridia bacterium]|nr:hypothetical protein [Clostridia bacterium]
MEIDCVVARSIFVPRGDKRDEKRILEIDCVVARSIFVLRGDKKDEKRIFEDGLNGCCFFMFMAL